MGAVEAATAQVEKKCYRNNTAGWLGVVKLDHLGAQAGHSIEPYGTVYLSEEEAILTARAPKDPKDNPFVEQTFMFEDANGKRVEQGMRPLVLVEDDREIPRDDRYVPGHPDAEPAPPAHDVNLHSMAAGKRDAQAVLDSEDDREVPTSASAPTLVPSSTAAVPPSQARAMPIDGSVPAEPEEDVRESWVDAPDRTEEPQQGALSGSNEQVGAVDGDAAKTGSATGAPPQQPVVQQVASSSVEEHAAQTASGEETGAAETPAGQAPEGEFASHEEVGSPEAPNQDKAS